MTHRLQAYFMALFGALGALLGWALAAFLAPHIAHLSPVPQRALLTLPVGGFIGAFLSYGAVRTGGTADRPYLSWIIGLLVGLVSGMVGGAAAEGFFFYVFNRGGLMPRMLAWGLLGLFISLAPIVAAYFTAPAGDKSASSLSQRHRQEIRGSSQQQIIAAVIGGWVGGAVGGALMEFTAAHFNAWTHVGSFVFVGACIGASRTYLHGIITFANFTGQVLGENGVPLPPDKAQAVKWNELDGHSEKLIGTQVDTGSEVRMFPASNCKPIHARVFPKGGRLYIEPKEGAIQTVNGQPILGPQLLTDGFQFIIGSALMTYHEQARRV